MVEGETSFGPTKSSPLSPDLEVRQRAERCGAMVAMVEEVRGWARLQMEVEEGRDVDWEIF